MDCKIVENPSIVENNEWSFLFFRVFDLQNSGIPRNSGKILIDERIHYYEVLLYFENFPNLTTFSDKNIFQVKLDP